MRTPSPPLPGRPRPPCHILAALLFLTSLTAALPAHALSVVPRSFDELVQLADTILLATVKTVQSQAAGDQGIISLVTLSELQVIKGRINGEEYVLQVPGGVVGDRAEDYPGLPVLRAGQRYVLFVRGNRRDFFPVVGVTQGVFRVLRDARGRQVVVRDGDVAAAARSLAPLTAAAPTVEAFVRDIQARLPAVDPP